MREEASLDLPVVRVGLVSVSRDCFPAELSRNRRDRVAAALAARGVVARVSPRIVENETDALAVLAEFRDAGVNALVVHLGNFGPETPETLLAQRFDGPVAFVASAEESGGDLHAGRGDAYCGLLNASYNLGLRRRAAYIPENPVGNPEELADRIVDFLPVARTLIGLKSLKIIGFGPRPMDFLSCNAPIQPLYDLGVEVEENSELDLLTAFRAHEGDARIPDVVDSMTRELGRGNRYPDRLARFAQLELALLDWRAEHLGASRRVAFANKCWPAFQRHFGCVPCYVNARLAARGVPVACETDLYGALSEALLVFASGRPATLLDVNDNVPRDLLAGAAIPNGYRLSDLFLGFHCGNTASCLLKEGTMRHQLIMARIMEPETGPDITVGTLEGVLAPSPVTLFRLQSTAGGTLRAYAAQGETLDLEPDTYGTVGVFAVREMARFYRHVLVERQFPHHAGVGFAHCGETLFAALRILGVEDVSWNLPLDRLYPSENPFARTRT